MRSENDWRSIFVFFSFLCIFLNLNAFDYYSREIPVGNLLKNEIIMSGKIWSFQSTVLPKERNVQSNRSNLIVSEKPEIDRYFTVNDRLSTVEFLYLKDWKEKMSGNNSGNQALRSE